MNWAASFWAAGVRTLPVILGEPAARALTRALLAAFYPAIAVLVVAGALPWTALVAGAARPRLRPIWRAFGRPRPERPPPDFPVWPLWFAPIAFLHARRAGALLVIGLAASAPLTG